MMGIKNMVKTFVVNNRLENMSLRKLKKSGYVTILMYHGVCRDDDALLHGDALQVKASEFDKQMKYLSENFFVIPASRYKDIQQMENHEGKPIAIITFDDGYRNILDVAAPILQKYSLPATVFLVTGTLNADDNGIFWWDRVRTVMASRGVKQPQITDFVEDIKTGISQDYVNVYTLKWFQISGLDVSGYYRLRMRDIKKLKEMGLFEFGSHTERHEIITHIDSLRAKQTISGSMETLEGIIPSTQRNIYFSYPNGEYHTYHIQFLIDAGYSGAFSTQRGVADTSESFNIPRLPVSQNTSLTDFIISTTSFIPFMLRSL